MNLPDKDINNINDWLVRILGEPAQEVGGIISDWLKYFRAKRVVDLKIKYDQYLVERGIAQPLPVPPKYALPIVEHASLEDDDVLFEVWAKLLATASDPEYESGLRSAFIGILQQLDPLDVHLLDLMYQQITALEKGVPANWVISTPRLIKWAEKNHSVPQSNQEIKVSIDNLLRLRCVEIALEDKQISVPDDRFAGRSRPHIVSVSHGSDRIALTDLGRTFVRACITPDVPKDRNAAG